VAVKDQDAVGWRQALRHPPPGQVMFQAILYF